MLKTRLPAWMLLAYAVTFASAQEDFLPAEPLGEIGFVKQWQLELPLSPGQTLQDAYLVDDQLYLGTDDGYCYAIHAYTGAVRWLKKVTGSGYRLRRPCHTGDRVIFVNPVNIVQLDRLFGRTIATRDLDNPASSAGVTDGRRLYYGGYNGRIYAIGVEDQFEVWKAVTGGAVRSQPALYGENLYVASDAGAVYGCKAENKRFLWQSTTRGMLSADIVVAEAGVFVPCLDQSLYLFDLQFGNVRWRARLSGPLREAPLVVDDLAYQYCAADGLVAVETAVLNIDERFRWKIPNGRKALTQIEGTVYVLTRDDQVFSVDVETGEVLGATPAFGFTLPMPSVDVPALYLASPDGRVFCARPPGTPPVLAEQVRAALRPPGEEAGETPAPTTQPAEEGEAPRRDVLESSGGGRPIGGRSKVSKEFGGGNRGE